MRSKITYLADELITKNPMSQPEAYLLLFTDVLFSNFAASTSPEVIMDSMQIFGGYNKKLIISAALLAYMCSVIINYLLGMICYKVLAPVNQNASRRTAEILKQRNISIHFLLLLLALSCLPFFGKFIVLFSGFCRINFKTVFFVSILAKFAYYLIYLNIPLII